jgi:hypothetical protein
METLANTRCYRAVRSRGNVCPSAIRRRQMDTLPPLLPPLRYLCAGALRSHVSFNVSLGFGIGPTCSQRRCGHRRRSRASAHAYRRRSLNSPLGVRLHPLPPSGGARSCWTGGGGRYEGFAPTTSHTGEPARAVWWWASVGWHEHSHTLTTDTTHIIANIEQSRLSLFFLLLLFFFFFFPFFLSFFKEDGEEKKSVCGIRGGLS